MPFVLANIFQPLIDIFEQVLLFFHDTVGLSWGLSIIALTVTVRTLLIPLTLKQFRSMRALQQHMPEMKALQEKYKDDRQRLNQEMMKFYSENKINPFASCLPLIAQLPVFIALFYMLQKDLKVDICGDAIEAAGKINDLSNTTCGDVGQAEKFLFIPDITAAATGGVLVALLVLYIGSQLLSSVLMSVTADRNQRIIMIALPFVFTIFIINFPAGLLVYWITTNLWTIVQQFIVRRTVGPVPKPGEGLPAAAGKGDGDDAKPKGLLARAAAAGAGAGSGSGSGGGNGKAASGASTSAPKRTAAPPPPPSKRKKKKTGRRR